MIKVYIPSSNQIYIAIAKDLETNEKLVLIEKIYRIPVRKYIYEFPAGMRDPGEDDPIQTGLRELKEETGYVGHNARVTDQVKSDPWKSNGTHIHMICEIDLSLPENQNPEPNLEAEEDITPMWVKLKGIQQNLEKLADENDHDLDQRLYAWAMGIEYARKFGVK